MDYTIEDILKEEFNDDPLFKYIYRRNLEENLFNEKILSMDIESSYSTSDASKILERPDSTIRNHFRSGLVDYIRPTKMGKYYRLDYRSIFRLHMIFIMIEKDSRTTVDILDELGYPQEVITAKFRRVQRNESSFNALQPVDEQDSKIDTKLTDIEKKLTTLTYDSQINRVEGEITKLIGEIEKIKSEIEITNLSIQRIKDNSQLKFLSEKQDLFTTFTFKKLNTKKSIWGKLKDKFKEQADSELNELNSQIEKLKEKYELNLKKEIQEHTEKLNLLKSEKEKLSLEKEEKEKEKEKLENVKEFHIMQIGKEQIEQNKNTELLNVNPKLIVNDIVSEPEE